MSEKITQSVLTLLQENARISNAEIAAATGESESTIHKLIADLKEEGIIVGFSTILNPEKKPGNNIKGVIEVSINPEQRSGYDAIAQYLSTHPKVDEVYLISGHYDFLVMMEGNTLQEISDFISEIASIRNVTKTVTHVVLKTFKLYGRQVRFPSDDSRLSIIP